MADGEIVSIQRAEPELQTRTVWLMFVGLAGLVLAVIIAVASWIPDAAAPAAPRATPSVTPTPKPAPTPSYATATAGESWDDFYAGAIEPLAGAIGFVSACALGFLVLARLMVEIPAVRKRRSSRADRRALSVTGWGLVVLVPLLICIAGIWMDQGMLAPNMVLLGVLIAVGLVGALAVAERMASGLKLELTVTGAGLDAKQANLARADVVTALQRLAEPAHWVELPSGVDLADLAKSLGALSTSPIVEGIRSVVLFVVGVTPWRITVTQIDAGDATVAIARNGRTKREERVSLAGEPYDKLAFVAALLAAPEKSAEKPAAASSPKKLTKSDKQADAAADASTLPRSRDLLATAIAALIVSEIATVEVHDFGTALVGATDPTGIALHSMATTWYLKDGRKAEAHALLTQATRIDPYNRHALWTLDWEESRDKVEIAEMTPYMGRLHARVEERRRDLGDRAPLVASDVAYSSMLMALAAVTRNIAATTGRGMTPELVDAIEFTRRELSTWLATAEQGRDQKTRIARQRARIDIAALSVALGDPDVDPFETDEAAFHHPVLAYSLACYQVRWRALSFGDQEVARLLATAMINPLYFEFAAKDPEFRSATDASGYRRWLTRSRAEAAKSHPGTGEEPPAGGRLRRWIARMIECLRS